MVRSALLVWILGLLTAVPWAVWFLFTAASRDQYALLIVGSLFWVFGYWALAIDFIARDNGLPRFLAEAVYRRLASHLLTTPEERGP